MNNKPVSLAVPAALLLAAGSFALQTAHAAPPPKFLPIKSSIAGVPASAKPNQVLNITLTVDELGKSVPGGTVDLEIQDNKGNKAVQKFWEHQNVVKGKTMTYTWAFNAPMKPGVYKIYTGVFTAGWKQVISFDLKTGVLKVA